MIAFNHRYSDRLFLLLALGRRRDGGEKVVF
jgi:hypothetical protein